VEEFIALQWIVITCFHGNKCAHNSRGTVGDQLADLSGVAVLDSLSLFAIFFVQIATLFTADCSFLVELSTVSPIAMTAVSSANVTMVLFHVVGTSLI
jgi:hypothetical protein